MGRCAHVHAPAEGERGRCPRPAIEGRDRCPFHLSPDERAAAGVSSADLREAFLADLRSGEGRRERLVGARFGEFDLSSLVLEGADRGRIVLEDVTVEGTLDLSTAVVGHPIDLRDCAIAHLDLTDATVEGRASIVGGTYGDRGSGTCLTVRRATFEAGLEVTGTAFEGPIEFAACTVEGWLDIEDAVVSGQAHFPRASIGMAQFVDATVEAPAEFAGADVDHLAIEGGTYASPLDFSGAHFGTLRSRPEGDLAVDLGGATVSGGRLDQPGEGRVLYDLAEATVGDVALDCTPATFDRYRFFRTAFEGFPFAAYRDLLREVGWRIHEYAGDTGGDDVADLEITHLKAKQGATGVGDNESAAAFFVHEMRHRRERYAAHLRDPSYGLAHRLGGVVRWATNATLGVLAGYGERPGRVLLASLAVLVGAGVAYPAIGVETAGGGVLTYADAGAGAALDGLYFSVVTFTTLGFGDITPASGLGRLVAGAEALAGAFLTALFVFTLGRSVTR